MGEAFGWDDVLTIIVIVGASILDSVLNDDDERGSTSRGESQGSTGAGSTQQRGSGVSFTDPEDHAPLGPFGFGGGFIPGSGFGAMMTPRGVVPAPAVGPQFGWFKGGPKDREREQIDSIARKHKINRNDFGDYVERRKHKGGRGGRDNYTYSELEERAKEYKGIW